MPGPAMQSSIVRVYQQQSEDTSDIVSLYQHCDYDGYAVGLAEGSYTLSQLQALGAVNDDLSSLKIQSGYQVTLYEHDNFQGASLVNNLNEDFNDRISSVVVSRIASAWSLTIEAEDYAVMSGIETGS